MLVDSQPLNYKVDISPLFNVYCSKHAVDTAADFLGGFDKLTDISCHIALTVIKDNDHQLATNLIHEAVGSQLIEARYIELIKFCVMSYATVLRQNFLNLIRSDSQYRPINHVQVHDAYHDYSPHSTARVSICGDIRASVYWHN